MVEGTNRPDDGREKREHNRTKRDTELPTDVVDEAELLTRRARRAVDPNEAAAYRDRRASILSDHGFRARVREEGRDTLVLYPDEWVRDGTAQLDQIDDVDRATERPLEGPGETDEWEVVENHNRELAETIAAEHGPIHGDNVHALADFASNHYAKQIGKLTAAELTEFREEYFPRNAWPSDDQKTVVSESIRLTFAAAGQPVPTDRS
jgi:hypothetical protein